MSLTNPRGERRVRGDTTPSAVDPEIDAVNLRALKLIQAIWRVERWKTSISAKANSYVDTLLFERKLTPPRGMPQRIVQIVQQCVAQACLELNMTGLHVQTAPWYPRAAEAARQRMKSS